MKPIQLISPVDGSVYAERMPLTRDAAVAAATRAKAAQKAWAARPLAERIALVKTAVANLNAMTPRVVEELAWQMGRPTRFGGEFGGVNARTDYMSEIAAKTLAPHMIEDSDKFRRYIARQALGVVFIIAPWNYPYLTTVNTLVPALIAGNTVILKHASQTMLVGERIAEAFHAAGIPAELREPNVFMAAKRGHSQKPAEFFRMVERVTPDATRLEMFARQPRAGWTTWGNEADGSRILAPLAEQVDGQLDLLEGIA